MENTGATQLWIVSSNPTPLTKDSERVKLFLISFLSSGCGLPFTAPTFLFLPIGKKNLKKWEKTLDKSLKMCYNISTKRKRGILNAIKV